MQSLVTEVFATLREAERLAALSKPGTPVHTFAVGAALKLRYLYAEMTADPSSDMSSPAFLAGVRREIMGWSRSGAGPRLAGE